MTAHTNLPAKLAAQLKARLKHGPRMRRQLRAEFLLTQVQGAAPRRLRPEVIAKIKAELERIAQSTKPSVRRFVLQMFERYPEVRP